VNLASGFAQQRIVHRNDQRSVAPQGLLHRRADPAKDRLLVKPILGIEAVIGRPIPLVAVLRPQQRTDGMAAETDQVGQDMTAGPLEALGAGKSMSRSPDQVF
jgi:hypothetical protein